MRGEKQWGSGKLKIKNQKDWKRAGGSEGIDQETSRRLKGDRMTGIRGKGAWVNDVDGRSEKKGERAK